MSEWWSGFLIGNAFAAWGIALASYLGWRKTKAWMDECNEYHRQVATGQLVRKDDLS